MFSQNLECKAKQIGLSLLLIAMLMFLPVYAKSSLSELDKTYNDYQRAFNHYTSLVASSKNTGNVEEALEEYRSAYARYLRSKEISDQAVVKTSNESISLDSSGIDGIIDVDVIVVWRQNREGVYQLFITDRNDRSPISISPKYKHFSSYSPVTICSSKGSLAYTAGVSPTPDQSKLNIYYKESISIEPLLLLKSATALGFSPDCNKLLYRKNTGHKLYLYSFITKETELFFEGLPINTAAWSPDGKHIVIESQKKGAETELFLLSDLDNYPNIISRNITNTKIIREKYPFFGGNENIFYSEVKNKKISLNSMNIYSNKVKSWGMKDVDVCMSTLGDGGNFLCHPVYTQDIKVVDNNAGKEFVIKGMTALWFPQGDTENSKEGSNRVTEQQQGCEDSKEFEQLLKRGEAYIQSADYKKALESYEEAYHSCPTKDLEELIAELVEIDN